MLSAWMLSAVLSFAQDPAARPTQDGASVTLDQDAATTAQRNVLKLYEARDILDSSDGLGVDGSTVDLLRFLDSLCANLPKDTVTEAVRDQILTAHRERRMSDRADEFAGIVRRFMSPAYVADVCSVKCTSAGSLVVSATAAQHKWLFDFLNRQRDAKDTIEIQARFLIGPSGCFKELAENATHTLATQEQLDAALARIKTPLDTLLAPRLTCFNLHPSSIEAMSDTAVVSDYHVRTVEPGPREIAEPVIQTIRDGVSVKARAFELADDSYGIALETTLANLKRPIRTSKVPLQVNGVAQEVEVALPEVDTVRFSSDAQVKSGGSALFVVRYHDDRDLALIVTVRRGAPVERPAPVDPPERK